MNRKKRFLVRGILGGVFFCAGALFFLLLSGNLLSSPPVPEKKALPESSVLFPENFFPVSFGSLPKDEFCTLSGEELPGLFPEFLRKEVFLWERYLWLSPDVRVPREPLDEKIPLLLPPEGRVVILLDDVGNSGALGASFASLEIPLTWAILPGESQTEKCRNLAEARGIPYMVHMPMQALGDTPGSYWYRQNWIVEGMSREEIALRVHEALEKLPKALGMNNHRGSLATEDPRIMEPFLDILAEKGLFFLDSRTTSKSLGAVMAAEKGLPRLENHVFLDHKKEPEFFRSQMKRLLELGARRGWAVGICHARSSTYEILKEMETELGEDPRLITLPELVHFLGGQEIAEKGQTR